MAAIGIMTAQRRTEREVGQIHVYDGTGKGKSQAALGVVLRSLGLGMTNSVNDLNSDPNVYTPRPYLTRILLLRFLKGVERDYEEDAAIAALQQGFPHLIDHVRTGRAEYFDADHITSFDRREAERGWAIAKGAIASGLYSVIVLDEINPVLDLGLLSVDEVVNDLAHKPSELEVICTGRGTPQRLLDMADLHSEMRPHHSANPEKYGVSGIEIYTGAGKGKSTSALGRSLKAIGTGISRDLSHRVLIVQWLKGGTGYTEDAAIAALQKGYPHVIDHQRCGRDAIVWRGQQQELDFIEAQRGWEIAQAALASGLYKTIILDELNPTVDLDLLPVEPICEALLQKNRDTEVIITGRCMHPPAYFELASVHSEMVCHKHYAEKGVDLKRGVDF